MSQNILNVVRDTHTHTTVLRLGTVREKFRMW